MAFECKNYPKYPVTLGEYYGKKVGLYHFADTILFDTEYGKETFSQNEIELKALERHGNKLLISVPDWYITIYNSTGTVYDGTYDSYIAMLNSWLLQFMWNNYNNSNYKSLVRIFNALNAEYSPIENTDKYAEWTDSHNGTDTVSKTGTDTLTKAGMDRLLNSGTETTDINGKEINTKGGSDSVTYGKTDTHTVQLSDTTNIAGQEKDELTKDGSILENNDTDNYTFPFNGTNKEHTDHQDSYTNTRYGKYKDTDGNPQSDKYSETNTKTYTNRSDSTVHSGNESNASTGSDTTKYGMTDTTEYTGRNNKLTIDTRNITEYDTTDTNEYNTTDTNTYNSNMKHIEHTHGNIGVTTNQAMIKEELSLRLGNSFLNILVDDLAAYICME